MVGDGILITNTGDDLTKLKGWDRGLAVLAGLAIGVYFFRLTRPALHTYFTADDFQNLWRGWFFPLGSLLKANLLFFWTSDFNRPTVADWYRVILHFAGMDPFWFRAANLAAHGGNIFLTYAVTRRLTGSRETAMVTALLFSYSKAQNYLYFDTGYTCDVLCYLFYFGNFLYYLRIRQEERAPTWRETAVLAVLFVGALNAKEIAATLPLVLGVYELLWHKKRQWRAVAILGSFVAAMAAGRVLGPHSLTMFEEYRPVLTWGRFMLTSGTFLANAMGEAKAWNQWAVLGTWAGLAAVAWFSGRRDLRFAWCYVMLSPLPVAFIPPRGTQQYFLPWFGWMLFIGILLMWPVEYLTNRAWGRWSWLPRSRAAAVLAVLIAVRYPYYKKLGWQNVASVAVEGEDLRYAVWDLFGLEPKLKPGARVLFLKDPIATDWTLQMMALVGYRDRNLSIYDARMQGKMPDEATMATFDYVFDYKKGRFQEVRGPKAAEK